MKARNLRPFALLILALAVVACDKGRQPPPKTFVRVINVAPNFESLDFRREETTPVVIDFKGSHDPQAYDQDTYDFHVQGRLGNEQPRILSFEKEILAETTYAFVLHTVGDSIGNAIVEYPPLPAEATDSQVVALHAGESLPAIDMHIAPAGTNVNGAVPWGTLGFLQRLAPRRLATGSYEVTLTAAGDPNNVLLTSAPFALGPGRTSVFVITPEGGQTNQLLSVFFLQDVPGVLIDRNAPASLRAINAATDRAPRDVTVASQFSPPLFPAVPFGQATEYAPTPVGTVLINATPPGNPGVLELNVEVGMAPAVQYTTFITGDAGVLKHTLSIDDNRRIATVGKLRLFSALQQYPNGINFFVAPPGTDLDTRFPTAFLLPGTATSYFPFTAGEYLILLLEPGTGTIIAGPFAVTLDSSGIYGILAVDGANGTADLVRLDDFL